MNTTAVFASQNHTDKQASFSSPLDLIEKARLKITNGISNFDLRGGSAEADLFRAHFTGLIPEIRVDKEVVTVYYRLSLAEWVKYTFLWNRHTAELSLNANIPWEIELQGGVSNMQADLRTLALKSLAFKSSVSRAEILLPRPSGTVPIYVMGGSSKLLLSCSVGVSVQLRANGGVNQLTFGEQFFGSAGERLELETPGYEKTTDRYDIRVCSGASQLTVLPQKIND